MTKKIICPDCGLEVDKLVSSTGTCISCYKRYQDKKHKGKEYIPLIKLKGTTEYNRAMGKRLKTRERKTNQTANEKIEENSEITKSKIIPVEGYQYIDINSTQVLETIDYLKNCLDRIPEMESQVSNMTEELLVISHKKERTDGPGDKEYEKLSIREYHILKYRRQLKDALVYLSRIDPKILNDNLKKELNETKVNYETDQYVPKYQSKSKKYTVSVNVGGLHGSPQIECFKRLVFADNDVEAKAYVEDYLKKLSSVVIYGKTWRIEEIGENKGE